jgi:hypothetical protein
VQAGIVTYTHIISCVWSNQLYSNFDAK